MSNKDKQLDNDLTDGTATETPVDTVAARIDDGKKLRLAMALIDGMQSTSDDRAANTAFLRTRLARAAGQDTPPPTMTDRLLACTSELLLSLKHNCGL